MATNISGLLKSFCHFIKPWLLPAGVLLLILIGIGICGHFGRKLAPPQKNDTDRFDRMIRRSARRHMPGGWDWRILKAMIRKESIFNPETRSPGGAVGLCQLLPKTARTMGLSPGKLHDPAANIDAGARYLRSLWDYWRSIKDRAPDWHRTRFAIASYNAGLGRVLSGYKKSGAPRKWQSIKSSLPGSTQTHVETIMDVYLKGYRTGRSASGSRPAQASGRSMIRFWPFKSKDRGNSSQ